MSVDTHTELSMQYSEPRRLSLCMTTARDLAKKGAVNLAILQSSTACMFVCTNIALSVLATRDTTILTRPSMVLVMLCIAWVLNVCVYFNRNPMW